MLTHLEPQDPKNGKSTKHRKTRLFLAGGEWVAGRGRGPSLLRRGENCRTAMPQPRGPLAGFKRLRATAGQGPNYVGPACGYMLAYVGLMLTHVEPKDPKNGNSKKTL